METNPTTVLPTAQPLPAHVSADSAYVVADYPYGFRLRCTIRYWLEFKRGFGFRFVSQTTNPKRPGEVWNKPKAGTYSRAAALYLDELQHVHCAGLSEYSNGPEVDAFKTRFAECIAADPNLTDAIAWFEQMIALRDRRGLAGGRLIP